MKLFINNLKKEFLKTILSLIALFCLAACQSTDKKDNNNYSQAILQIPKEVAEIAILMPLSGSEEVLGQQYDELIKIGLSDGARNDLKVTSYDGSDDRKILRAMDEIIARNTEIILGPISSPLTKLIAGRALENNIIIFTLSNDPALADDKLFVFGHAPLKQLDRMLDYLFAKNCKNIITLLPAGHHSQALNKIIQDSTIQNNATLLRTELYLSTPESIDRAVSIVSDTVDNLNETEDNISKPVIYIADDRKNLRLLFGSISKYNLDKKAIIVGDNRIDIGDQKEVDLIYTGSLNFLNSKLAIEAQEAGIYNMSAMHLISYDLGKVVARNIGEHFASKDLLNRINSKNSFIGLSGTLSFIDSIVQRKYDIIKRQEGIYSTIDSDKE
ncbi:MAG: hypothetical protein ACRYE9_02050 [Janthinobacterium lividum]